MASSTGGQGGRKIGRGLRGAAHTRYVNTGQRIVNKIRKLVKHLKKSGDDPCAEKALKKWRD